ncbi:MAG: signal peptide peptidase SppA [Bacteroidota bacterium]
MKFLRNLLAAIIGCLIAFGIVFVMFLIFASLVGSMEDGVNIKGNSILELRMERPIKDYVGSDPADPLSGFFDEYQGLDDILEAIASAKEDPKIKGISISNNFMMAGLAQTQAVRKELAKFKESGKFVHAFGDFYMQKDYYLATVADSVFLNPVGGMDFRGLSSEVLFFKDLQEKTGIKMEVIRHGKYKSAVEPFLANEMSDANRTQIKELLSSLWSTMVADISLSRGMMPETVNRIADTLGGRTPEYALNNGLIDGILHFDQYEAGLRKAIGVGSDADINYVALKEYIGSPGLKGKRSGKDKVAVIFAQGEIVYGEGGPDAIGQGIINEALAKARDNKSVKAIVLRVDSPGGSALTSDIIWREIALAKEKKPVVVSMGNVAASGGYYIACGADKILAEATTVTGSIGVFGVIPNVSELSKDIGINAEQVGTNLNSVHYSVFEPMTDHFRNVTREGVEDIYDIFLQRVAQGRGISVARADSLGQGRVWSGADAQRMGLVDQLGTLDDAIEVAAELAEITEYGIKKYPKYKSGFERFMEDFGGAGTRIKNTIIQEEIGTENYALWQKISDAVKQKGIQARMPFLMDIK